MGFTCEYLTVYILKVHTRRTMMSWWSKVTSEWSHSEAKWSNDVTVTSEWSGVEL